MNLARRFGVRPATFVALGSLAVGLVLVDRKMTELETRLDDLSTRAGSTSVRLDVASESGTSAAASPGPMGPDDSSVGDDAAVGDLPSLVDVGAEVVGSSRPMPAPWERRRPFGTGLRPAFRSDVAG